MMIKIFIVFNILSQKYYLKFYFNYNPVNSNSRITEICFQSQQLAINTVVGERDTPELGLCEQYFLSF